MAKADHVDNGFGWLPETHNEVQLQGAGLVGSGHCIVRRIPIRDISIACRATLNVQPFNDQAFNQATANCHIGKCN
jgi:hypothetical protein